MSEKFRRKRSKKIVTRPPTETSTTPEMPVIEHVEKVKAIPHLPEAPSFIEGKEWSYSAKDIEDFRKKYEKFRKEYAEYKQAVAK